MDEYKSLRHTSPASSECSYHHAVYSSFPTHKPKSMSYSIRPIVFKHIIKSMFIHWPKTTARRYRRTHAVSSTTSCFYADINKMYRQILLTPEHRCYQHILWRVSQQGELNVYELNTVTYGVNCALFLAIWASYSTCLVFLLNLVGIFKAYTINI